MNAQQIADVARAAGFSGEALRIAVAVALAESSGNPQAHNPRGADDSYGLWQINMKGGLGPERRAAFGLSSNSQLFDPGVNAYAAYQISSGGSNWNPWTTFGNGTYRRFLPSLDGGGGDPAPLPDVETVTLESGLLSGLPVWAIPAGLLLLGFSFLRR